MVITEEDLARLAAKNAQLEAGDDELHSELTDTRGSFIHRTEEGLVEESLGVADTDVGYEGQAVHDVDLAAETIVYATGRPVLTVLRDSAVLTFTEPQSEVWRTRLSAASDALSAAARAVGRVEVEGHEATWLGTGWLVDRDIIVTNRHVAKEFGRADGARFVYRQGIFGPMTASIDFLEEAGRPEDLTFKVSEILHIEDDAGPDIAFLRVNPTGPGNASPISLADNAKVNDFVAVIGYPARDSRIPDQDLMERLFGSLYDKKRLAPGQVTAVDRTVILHDATTLGGNSGSVVVSLDSGEAVGLHFAGRFLKANYGVPATVVRERLSAVSRKPIRPTPTSSSGSAASDGHDRTEHGGDRLDSFENGSARLGNAGALAPTSTVSASPQLTAVVPLRITIEVGDAVVADGSPTTTAPATATALGPSGEDTVVEAAVSDYRDRRGFDQAFLGAGNRVLLPTMEDRSDILSFHDNGETSTVLKYEHFSVVMSKSRRLCRFSAVNIDGRKRARMDRTGWRSDPRIPADAQIRYECYGDPPKYSRGHMTRREDPVWGPVDVARRANDDSMHVTNAVPQMQSFNAGVWLDLENYALQNARQDDMKICVITGPFLSDDDPVQYGVKIPVKFWKVIVFIHDVSEELTATGYSLSQRTQMPEEEFVFGQFKTSQHRIDWIERNAGLSFNGLADLDPFREPEGVEDGAALTTVHQILFR